MYLYLNLGVTSVKLSFNIDFYFLFSAVTCIKNPSDIMWRKVLIC